MPIIRRHRKGTQAKSRAAGPGSKSVAEAPGGILESWESRTVPTNRRTRTTPAYQRPGAKTKTSLVIASENREATRAPASEGNRNERENGGGSLRGLIVADESRRTEAGGSL